MSDGPHDLKRLCLFCKFFCKVHDLDFFEHSVCHPAENHEGRGVVEVVIEHVAHAQHEILWRLSRMLFVLVVLGREGCPDKPAAAGFPYRPVLQHREIGKRDELSAYGSHKMI